ncbi:MAG: 6,7-dimethyl-8-ribityllumazine synthase [Acidobacteria bacterium ACB1]|nr:6,7-dimethyl-8-ribityllumazine synthase [Pyrinomonadaceae bacterium]MCE7961039.1 6,7-dimethyl-8-ribityllumazine synthase [Acidobacteria bacterium ACB1]RIJ94069.1 MAG: 6,7-dimethyl-8-ribityllumazine synthase [Acidobacteriota bacterium]
MKTDLENKGLSANSYRFAIVVSRWNSHITSKLLSGARRALAEANAAVVDTFEVPGAFELPLASQQAAKTTKYDAVIALGTVIRGETVHFDLVAENAARGIAEASLETGVPILFGVLAVENIDQANARSGDGDDNAGYMAAISAIEMATVLAKLDPKNSARSSSAK